MAALVQLGMRSLPIAARLVGLGAKAGVSRGGVAGITGGLIKQGLSYIGINMVIDFLTDQGVPDTIARSVDSILDDIDALHAAGMLYMPEARWGSAQADVIEQLNYMVIETQTGLIAMVDNKRFWPQRFFQYRG